MPNLISVMRYMTGGSLTQSISHGTVSLEDAARSIQRVSSVLAYAHKNSLGQRELKPKNILFSRNGHPFISDLGIANRCCARPLLPMQAARSSRWISSPARSSAVFDKCIGFRRV